MVIVAKLSILHICGNFGYVSTILLSLFLKFCQIWIPIFISSRLGVFCRKGALEKFRNPHRKTPASEYPFHKTAGWRFATWWKRDSVTDIFQRILWNFREHLFGEYLGTAPFVSIFFYSDIDAPIRSVQSIQWKSCS